MVFLMKLPLIIHLFILTVVANFLLLAVKSPKILVLAVMSTFLLPHLGPPLWQLENCLFSANEH